MFLCTILVLLLWNKMAASLHREADHGFGLYLKYLRSCLDAHWHPFPLFKRFAESFLACSHVTAHLLPSPHLASNTKNQVIFSTSYDECFSWTTTNCALGPTTSFTIEFDFLEMSLEDQNLALMFFRYCSSFVCLWMVFCSELSRLWEYCVPGQRLFRLQHIPKMFSFPLLVSYMFFFSILCF